jgi:hypothetical protein
MIAMAGAAGGYLVPVAGAIVQEAIDAAVILNALRSLGGYRTGRLEKGPAAALAGQFRSEHAELLPIVNRLRSLADRLDAMPRDEALRELKQLHVFLSERLVPHEEAEEKTFYPKIAEILGGDDPTGTMARAHVEIAHLVRMLGDVLGYIGPSAPDASDFVDLRRILYGLYAILRLHFAQEEEAYISLVGVPAATEEPSTAGASYASAPADRSNALRER